MLWNLALKYALSALLVIGIGVGGYYVLKAQSARTLTQNLDQQLEAGDYLAALGAAGNLKAAGKTTPELDEKIAEAARLLVADDAFKKAKAAVDEKRYADASALLKGSSAVTDPSFKYFEEAKKLYDEAEAISAGEVHKAAITVSSLQAQAAAEKTKRESSEQMRAKLEGTLRDKDRTITAAAAAAKAAADTLAESQKDAEAKQAALAAEQARSQALTAEVAKQSTQKFMSELRVYRDMADKGRQQLESALSEINGKRDVTALVYISQGKILFEEAKAKAADLRSTRTPAAYGASVDDLVSSLSQFLEAAKQFRNAVVYIEDQGSAEFTSSFGNAKTALANAVSHLSTVSDLIAENP